MGKWTLPLARILSGSQHPTPTAYSRLIPETEVLQGQYRSRLHFCYAVNACESSFSYETLNLDLQTVHRQRASTQVTTAISTFTQGFQEVH